VIVSIIIIIFYVRAHKANVQRRAKSAG